MPDLHDVPSRRAILRSSTLLGGLTEEQQQELAANSIMAHAEKGETIWITGNTVDFFGVVGTGFVKMTSFGPNHQEITTEIMGPGQVFGLLGVIDGTGCPQSAKAVTGTWYLKIRKGEFMPTYESNFILKEQIFRRTAHRLKQSFDLIAHLSVGTVEQRVAAVLLVLTRSFGQEGEEGIVIDVPLTRQDISELAGTTVESTIRVISRWQKQGWVETQAKHIMIRDLESLMAAVR